MICDPFNYTLLLLHYTGEVQGGQPTLVECVRFRGRDRRINISQEIGTKYITFGILLLEETTGERVSAIAHKHMYDSEQTCLEILEEWIAGSGKQPVTWSILIEVLRDTELGTLAREVEAVKLPEGDNGEIPTGSIEDVRHEEEVSVNVTEADISVNINRELGFNCGDTKYSEILGQELKDQANDASGEIGRTKDRANDASGEIGRTKDQENDASGEIGRTKDRASDASGEISRTKVQANDAPSEIGGTKVQTMDASGEIGGTEMSMGLIEDENLD